MRNGLEGRKSLREAPPPPALTSTHSVLVPPPSNPSAWDIQKGYDRLAAGARRSRRGVRILPLLCPRSMRAARLTRSQAAHYHRATFHQLAGGPHPAGATRE